MPVNTAWDIGVGDENAIWFWQKLHGKIGIVGYYQNSGEGLPFYVGKLEEYAQASWLALRQAPRCRMTPR